MNRPHADFRGYAGTLVSGHVRVGDSIMALPSRRISTIKEIVTYDGNLSAAFAPMAVTLHTSNDEIDIVRGDVLAHPDRAPTVAREFDAHVIWMADQPLLPGSSMNSSWARTMCVALSRKLNFVWTSMIYRITMPKN